jgi:GAF domain-containing protein
MVDRRPQSPVAPRIEVVLHRRRRRENLRRQHPQQRAAAQQIQQRYALTGDGGLDRAALITECNSTVCIRLVGALLLEQNDEWAVWRARSTSLETIAPLSDNHSVGPPAMAA